MKTISRPPIFPAEWLEEQTFDFPGEWENRPVPSLSYSGIEDIRADFVYKPPYTVEEIKRLCPGLYGPVEH